MKRNLMNEIETKHLTSKLHAKTVLYCFHFHGYIYNIVFHTVFCIITFNLHL